MAMHSTGRFGLLARGLLARGGLSLTLLLVAVVAAAAAATGPTYYAAAKRSILADALHGAPIIGQGVEITDEGPTRLLDQLARLVTSAQRGRPGRDLLAGPIRGQELQFAPVPGQTSQVAWRSGLCAHLRMLAGHCPRAAGEFAVSRAMSRLDGLRLGARVRRPLPGRVVGIYSPRAPNSRYWFNRGYFPQEGISVQPFNDAESVDAVLTVPATFARASSHTQVVSVLDLPLRLDQTTPRRIADLRDVLNAVAAAVTANFGAAATTSIGTVLDTATTSWQALAVPVYLITGQLLMLVWLLLFLVITDSVQARAPEVALAKVRGLRRNQTIRFGLAEPVSLLLLALPIGVAAGWGASAGLTTLALRPGTPVVPNWGTVAAAAVAVSGGLLATVLAARRTLIRPVLDQWRRAERRGVRRGWTVDVVVLTLAIVALVQLYVSGAITSAAANVFALLVPGLVGIAVAVLVSRLLPLLCRAAFGRTRGNGGLGPFLAVRQVARRPAGMRTLIVLAGSFALATFALSGWLVTRANIADVAGTRVGAAAVLQVQPKPGEDLATTVDRLDPSGTQAMAVSEYVDYGNRSRQTIAVEPARFARIAFWRSDFSTRGLNQLARELEPPAAAPVHITGDRLRLRFTDVQLNQPLLLEADVKAPNGAAATPLILGTLRNGTDMLDVALPSSPNDLRDLSLTDRSGGLSPAASGHFTLTAVQGHDAYGWHRVPAGLTDGSGWAWSGDTGAGIRHSIRPGAHGLTLSFTVTRGAQASWSVTSWPTPLPALLTPGVTAPPGQHRLTVAGLDGQQLPVSALARVPVPGAPDGGVIIDRTYALRAAYDTTYTSSSQVWLASSAVDAFPARLRAAGVRVIGSHTSAEAARQLGAQGPALALSLLLADAAAAAVLAAVGAVIGLHLAGRRRQYELAALVATGATQRQLCASVLLEQALTLGLGLLAGVGAGLLAMWLALPSVPEFVTAPSAPALRYRPDAMALSVPLAAAAVAVAVAAGVSAVALVRAARPDRLREEPA